MCGAGQPPTWARRRGRPSSGRSSPSLDEDVHIVDNYWRRKFLWFPAEKGDDGIYYQQPHWGVYYGSWSKTRQALQLWSHNNICQHQQSGRPGCEAYTESVDMNKGYLPVVMLSFLVLWSEPSIAHLESGQYLMPQ